MSSSLSARKLTAAAFLTLCSTCGSRNMTAPPVAEPMEVEPSIESLEAQYKTTAECGEMQKALGVLTAPPPANAAPAQTVQDPERVSASELLGGHLVQPDGTASKAALFLKAGDSPKGVEELQRKQEEIQRECDRKAKAPNNRLARYLDWARLRTPRLSECPVLKRALTDVLKKPAGKLQTIKYSIERRKLTVEQLLKSYFVAPGDLASAEGMVLADAAEAEAQEVIQRRRAELDTECARIKRSSRNRVSAYLDGAEVQFEKSDQCLEIRRALTDMISKPPADIRQAKYADFSGTPDKWTIVQLLNGYFVPHRPMSLPDKQLMSGLAKPEARASVQHWLDELDGRCERQARDTPNPIVNYLEGAYLLAEPGPQIAEVKRALEDALQNPPDALRNKTYASDRGEAGRWPLIRIVRSYFVPPVPQALPPGAFYEEVAKPEARVVIRRWLERLRQRDGE